MDTATFLETHPVFSLDEAVEALQPASGRQGARDRLKYAVRRGRVKRVAGTVYVTVPAGVAPSEFQPDSFLVAATLRKDAVFSYHSALELLGAAHSEWQLCTVATHGRHKPVRLESVELRFLLHPPPLVHRDATALGTRLIVRRDHELRVTGPERTLLDGFRRPDLAGGLAELVESASGFSVLDLDLLLQLLEAYAQKKLWAATGWFLERHRASFYVHDNLLEQCVREAPRRPQYLVRSERNGVIVPRWNLLLPASLARSGEPDEPRP